MALQDIGAEPRRSVFGKDAIFQPTVLLALALMAIIVMMILPMPSWVLDIGLAVSFGLAILMFTTTLFIQEPLEFSAFPTVLLASLMLRLSLNVSSTKLIIGQGHTGTGAAGEVIQGFASFVMSGSVFMGLVVFGVLLIVNFIVITKGAARMAEVGARFALDGMPGKQLAIDSDVAAGAIDHAEAKARRERDQAETTFFGSLDGASKFVKGDAVAGLLITLLNLVMGLTIGVTLHGMPLGQAFETYAILTVGDGLVTQIPAVIISIASALLLARGGTTGSTDIAFFAQLGGYPPALYTVAVMMALFALVPGLPFLPFVMGAAILGFAGWQISRRREKKANEAEEGAEQLLPADAEPSIGDLLDLDDIHVEFAPDLVSMVLDPATGLEARIDSIRRHIATSYGLVLQEIRLTDNTALPPGQYVIRIQGVIQAQDRLEPDRALALITDDVSAGLPPGEDVSEPVYGAPARWISPQEQEQATMAGATLVNPAEVLATHLLEVIKKNLSRLLGMRSLRRLLDELSNLSETSRAEANRQIFDELIPDKVPMDLLLNTLRLLLEEQVSIRNLPLILEAIAEARSFAHSAEEICEHVRQRLGFQLIAQYRREDGTLPLIQLDPAWEERFSEYQLDSESGGDIALPPELFNHLATQIAQSFSKAAEAGAEAALVTSARRRRFLHMVLKAKGMTNPVFSYEEIGTDARPALVGQVAA